MHLFSTICRFAGGVLAGQNGAPSLIYRCGALTEAGKLA
jgi:hypothetical protein